MTENNRDIIRSAEIIAVGTELLMGQIVNTNAAWLARQLRELGITSRWQQVVGDNRMRIMEAIRLAFTRSDLVILTGGLGPTEDDISMEAAASACGLELVHHEESWQRIQEYFGRGNRPLTNSQIKQALMPKGAAVLPNDNGTAPGAVFRTEADGNAHWVMLLPGPPSENTLMFTQYGRPYLAERTAFHLESRFIHFIGIGESLVEDKIHDLIDAQTDTTIAPYASEGEVTIRVTAMAAREPEAIREAEEKVMRTVNLIRERLDEYIYEIGDRSLYEVTAALLAEKGLTVGFAESCTAGLLSARFGDIPGVSAVLSGGIVSYSNEVKTKVLGVRPETLRDHGAVSLECAAEMAAGAKAVLGCDYAVSVTGIAGPGGGTPEKPVGTICFAVVGPDGLSTLELRAYGNRQRIRGNAALWAANMLRRRILGL